MSWPAYEPPVQTLNSLPWTPRPAANRSLGPGSLTSYASQELRLSLDALQIVRARFSTVRSSVDGRFSVRYGDACAAACGFTRGFSGRSFGSRAVSVRHRTIGPRRRLDARGYHLARCRFDVTGHAAEVRRAVIVRTAAERHRCASVVGLPAWRRISSRLTRSPSASVSTPARPAPTRTPA